MKMGYTADQNDSPCLIITEASSSARAVLPSAASPESPGVEVCCSGTGTAIAEVRCSDRASGRLEDDPFDHVLQLANVARPAIGHQRVHRVAGELQRRNLVG